VFTDEVVTRLRAAQALQQANRAPSIKAGLELIRDGLAEAQGLATGREDADPIRVLADTVRALTEEITALRATVEAQGEQVKALGAPKDEQPAPQERGRGALDSGRLADLERRNRYLEGELKRRDEQPAPRRAWWRVWG
jgi:hypothetical protein